VTTHRASRTWKALTGAAIVFGALLFVWTVRAAGAGTVVEGIKRLGAGFSVVLVLSGARFFFRAAAWRLAMEPPEHLGFGVALSAVLAGDALGNVTPFGFFVSEPSKVLLVGRRVEPTVSIAALAVENLFYAASVVVVIVSGMAALLSSFRVEGALRTATVVTLATATGLSFFIAWMLATRRRFLSRGIDRLVERNIGRRFLEARRSHALEIEDRIHGFVGRQPGRVLPIAACEVAYNTAAVAEIWVALALITGTAPALITAYVLESTNRAVMIAFQFIPMWLGVDEAGTALMARALALEPAAGVSLALVRKARVVLWTALGMALFARRSASLNSAEP
jgi:hypothetical protein